MFRVLVLAGALVAGGLAAWLSLGFQSGPAPAATIAAEQVKTSDVLVAAVDLPQGSTLNDQGLRWQAWPDDAVNPSFISRSARPDALKELSGTVVRQSMVVGEPIREGKLATKGSGYLAALLPTGKRAVAVRVSAESSAGGFILPNDRVDVLHTTGNGKTRTLLTSILVLAIDQKASDSGADTAVGKTATLELDPKQAEAIAGAQASGALSLALRSTADNKEAPAFASRKTSDSADRKPTSRGGTVQIVRAGKSQIVQTEGPVE